MAAWQDIPWQKVQRHVFRLQKRRYRATQRGEVRTVRTLPHLLGKSWYARLLAVRRVTQDHRGTHPAGIDGVNARLPPQRWRLARALRLDGHATPVRPENPKLFANLTFLGFILMLDQRTSLSSDTPVRGGFWSCFPSSQPC
jgi:hypothetical protein